MSQVAELVQCNLRELILQLQKLKTMVFSGRLIVLANDRLSWTFLLRIGCLSWQTGGDNLEQRWQQHLQTAAPNIPNEFLSPVDFKPSLEREGYLLAQLQNRGLLNKQQLMELMTDTAIEILFDIIQWCKLNGDSISYQLIPNSPEEKVTLPLPLIDIEPILKRSIQDWQRWQNAGSIDVSPNLFPKVEEPEKLQRLLAPEKAQKLLSLISGKHTLRNIAAQQNQNLINLTQSLIPLVKIGAIVLSPTPKIEQISQEIAPEKPAKINDLGSPPPVSRETGESYLVVCIDDSIAVHQIMEKIVQEKGYKYLGIHEPLKALLMLLKNKPDAIFLDLLMPKINGYELCIQIRRAPSLKDVPIVMLTGKDGLVDRMRAKMSGSTDFLPKPIDKEAVLKMLDKYLIAL